MQITYEQIRPVIDRMQMRKSTQDDLLLYLKFEMQEIMKVLPPEVEQDHADGFHAGCCALRALSAVYALQDMLVRKAVA